MNILYMLACSKTCRAGLTAEYRYKQESFFFKLCNRTGSEIYRVYYTTLHYESEHWEVTAGRLTAIAKYCHFTIMKLVGDGDSILKQESTYTRLENANRWTSSVVWLTRD